MLKLKKRFFKTGKGRGRWPSAGLGKGMEVSIGKVRLR